MECFVNETSYTTVQKKNQVTLKGLIEKAI